MYLIPIYKTVLKREKVFIKHNKDWTEEYMQCLKACFDRTNWEMFIEAFGEDLESVIL